MGERAVRQVDDGAREGLVERRVRVAEAPQAVGAAERLLEGVAERDEGVLGRVVVVDWRELAFGGRPWPESILWRSPSHRKKRLQPPCLASWCSMWSRKPIPVSMSICCAEVIWRAWCRPPSRPCGMSISPPSKLTITATLVSFVLREILAVRAEPVEGDDILSALIGLPVIIFFLLRRVLRMNWSFDKIR